MTQNFDFIIVGKGMMGAAAARHLSTSGARIALIGPDEPADRASHHGVFASHYDNARITRTIDPDPVWALLARRSIERYGDIAAEGGVEFYSEAGCLLAAEDSASKSGYLDRVMAARDSLKVNAPYQSRADLDARFSYFQFPDSYAGVLEEKHAGHINPRALVLAQTRAAIRGGVSVVAQEVMDVRSQPGVVTVTDAAGETYAAPRVLIAAGGFSLSQRLFARPLDLTVKARTVLFAELSARDLSVFSAMPSLIVDGESQEESFYLLPPVLYPDCKWYIKIGGDPTDVAIRDEPSVRDWFRGEGNAQAARHMEGLLRRLLPSFDPVSLSHAPCVTTFTRHGRPYIGAAGPDGIYVLTGGNGTAAKSSDEIGRLGAQMLMEGRLVAPEYEPGFDVCFRD